MLLHCPFCDTRLDAGWGDCHCGPYHLILWANINTGYLIVDGVQLLWREMGGWSVMEIPSSRRA